jgi:hypothetical protein
VAADAKGPRPADAAVQPSSGIAALAAAATAGVPGAVGSAGVAVGPAGVSGPSPASAVVQPSPVASDTAGMASAVAATGRSARREVTPEAEAAASAAIAAAFAMPKLNLALHPKPLAAAGVAAAAAAGPAASGTSWGSGSCMFATPAAAFNSAGGASCGVTSDGSGQQYYTGQQGSTSINSRAVATTAATSKPRGINASCSPAKGADAAAETAARAAVAFAGFRVLAVPDQAGDDPPLSPVICGAPTGPAAAGAATQTDTMALSVSAVCSVGQQAPAVTATAQKRMLQELLGSPSDEASEASPNTSEGNSSCVSDSLAVAPLSPGSGDAVLPAAAASPAVVHSAAALATVGCESPGQDGARVGGAQSPEAPSPTLSVLGFVEASASADVAATKRLQRQQQQEQGGGRGKAADLAGLSFEQRLELLCAEDGSSSEASTSPQSLQSPAGTAAAIAAESVGGSSPCGSMRDAGAAAHGFAEDVGVGEENSQAVDSQAGSSSSSRGMLDRVQQSGSMACCATQTTPLAHGPQVSFGSTSMGDAGVAAHGFVEDVGAGEEGDSWVFDWQVGSSSSRGMLDGVQQSGSMACCATQTTPLPYGTQVSCGSCITTEEQSEASQHGACRQWSWLTRSCWARSTCRSRG